MRPILFSAVAAAALWLGGASAACADEIVTSGVTVVQGYGGLVSYGGNGGRAYYGSAYGDYVDLPYNLSTYSYSPPRTKHHHRRHAQEYQYARSCCETVTTVAPGYYYSPYVGYADPYHNWFYFNSQYYRPVWANTAYELGYGW